MKGDSFERVKRASFWVRGGGLSSGVSIISSPTSTIPTGGDDLGGWLIGDDAITGDNVIINKGGWISLGSGNASVTISAANPSWRLWAGNTNADLAPFRVSQDGILWAEDAHVSGEITASSGSLGTLSVDGALTISSAGVIKSTNYSAGLSGLYIDGQGNAEFNDIKVRGTLQTVVFEYDQVSAQSGGIIVTPSAGVLAQSYTTDGTMIIEGDAWVFNTGDTVRIRAKTTTGTVAEVWVTVTRTDTVNQYTTTKRSGASATWPAGTAVLGYGTGGGTLLLTAALEGSGPFYSVRTHGSQPWAGETEVVRLGNLRGSFGITTDVYGFGVGDFTAKKYLLWDGSDLHVRGRIYSDGMPIYGWNLCTNFSFEFGLSGWEQDTGYNSSDPPEVVTSPVFHGSYALRTRAWGNDYKVQLKTARIPVSPGTRVLFGCQIRNETDTGTTGGCQVNFVDAQGNPVEWPTALRSDVDTTWKACRWEATAPSGAAFMEFRLVNGHNTTDYQYFDSCYLHYRDMEISVAPDVKLDHGGLHVLGASIYTGWGSDSKILDTSYDQGHQHTVTLIGHRIKINDVWHIAIAI